MSVESPDRAQVSAVMASLGRRGGAAKSAAMKRRWSENREELLRCVGRTPGRPEDRPCTCKHPPETGQAHKSYCLRGKAQRRAAQREAGALA